MTDRHLHLDRLAVLCLVGCSAVWGLNQAAVKVALSDFPPLAQAGLRSLGAALLLAAWARWRRLPVAPTRETLWPSLLTGLLFAAEFGVYFSGLQYTSASRMVVFVYLSPFVVALGMPLIAPGERLGRGQMAGLLLAFAGVAGAFSESGHGGPHQLLGDAMGVLGAVLWGGTTLAIRATALSRASAEQTLMSQLAVSAVALLAASAWMGEAWPAQIRPLSWAALGFQTVIVTFASYLLWFWLMRHYPATKISAFTLLTPVFGLLAGVLLLGEPATPRILLALAAVAVGIALVSRPGPAAPSSSAPS